MEYINLGKSGLKVSRICLGAMTYGSSNWRPWILDEADGRPLIQQAIEAGINFFDTADVYSHGRSEEILGSALRDFSRREEVVIATKVYFPMGESPNERGLSRLHILRSIDESLRRLGTDYVDLYQIHRWDYGTPIEETLEALHDVIKAGKARYIGASSMYTWQFAKSLYLADRNGWTRFIAMQNHYNLVYREEEREMIPFCLEEGVGIIPWSPLARGFLTGTRKPGDHQSTTRAQTDDYAQSMYYRHSDFDVVAQVIDLAERRDLTPAQIALAWLLHKPGVTAPIIGASKSGHLEQAIAALDVQFSQEEIALLEETYQPHPVLGHD